jgi:hypothetical protein
MVEKVDAELKVDQEEQPRQGSGASLGGILRQVVSFTRDQKKPRGVNLGISEAWNLTQSSNILPERAGSYWQRNEDTVTKPATSFECLIYYVQHVT